MRNLVICLLVTWYPCYSQVPQTVAIQIYLEQGGVALNGQHELTVRWYDAPVGGIALFSEVLLVNVVDGLSTIQAGSTMPLPDTLLRTGMVWLGFSIDGGAELLPRTVLSSVPYALLAQRAVVAESLAPEVTGVVTSINEVAGNIEMVGSNGISITRSGKAIIVGQSNASWRGRIDAVAGQHRYRVDIGTAITNKAVIYATVHADTFVGVTVTDVDTTAGTFIIAASAPLQIGEWIEWGIQ